MSYSFSYFIEWIFIERILIHYLSNTKPPKNEFISYYIGKSSGEITNLHKGCYYDEQLSLIEIRLSNATLTCEMYKDVCIDARLFIDEDLVGESALFKSNQLTH